MGEGAPSVLGPLRPPPDGRGGLLRLHGRRWSQPGLRPSSKCPGWKVVHGGYPYVLEIRGVPGGTGAWGKYVFVYARTPPAGMLCAGGGDQATDQAPVTSRPNAAQSVVRGGIRAHTYEIVSLSPRGDGGPRRKWSWRSASPPISVPLGGSSSVWGGSACTLRGPRDNGEETKRRAAAMMLRRTGRDRDPLSVAVRPKRAGGHYGDVQRVRPTGGPHLLLLLQKNIYRMEAV